MTFGNPARKHLSTTQSPVEIRRKPGRFQLNVISAFSSVQICRTCLGVKRFKRKVSNRTLVCQEDNFVYGSNVLQWKAPQTHNKKSSLKVASSHIISQLYHHLDSPLARLLLPGFLSAEGGSWFVCPAFTRIPFPPWLDDLW